jgi:hypothetical protein
MYGGRCELLPKALVEDTRDDRVTISQPSFLTSH